MSTIENALRSGRSAADQVAAAAAARRLVAGAEDRGLLDVAWSRVDSPLGTLLVAGTSGGLCALWYEEDRVDAFLETLARRLSPRVLEAPGRLDPVRRELDEYFTGRRHEFTIDVDWSLVGGFAERVLRAAAAIPYGSVRTYRDVAATAGNPKASRAAGNALGSNPLALVVPCHRVLRTGGGLGGYTTGVHKKEYLLTLEGVRL